MHGIAQPDAFQTWEVQEATCFNNLFCAHFLESMVFQSWTVMDPLLDSLLGVKNHDWRLVHVNFALGGSIERPKTNNDQ